MWTCIAWWSLDKVAQRAASKAGLSVTAVEALAAFPREQQAEAVKALSSAKGGKAPSAQELKGERKRRAKEAKGETVEPHETKRMMRRPQVEGWLEYLEHEAKRAEDVDDRAKYRLLAKGLKCVLGDESALDRVEHGVYSPQLKKGK